jgi:ATP-dependent helicase IRC3
MGSTLTELLDQPILSLRVEAFSPPHSPTPWPHQAEAWGKMNRYFLDSPGSCKAGIVVVPTGGGKTWLASRWLLEKHVSEGGRLLWLTHRASLLRQASKNFIENAFRATPLPTLNLIRISCGEANWRQVTAQDQVVFSTIQTAASENNASFVFAMCDDSQKGLFVVVDEAHHAAAPSYVRVLTELKSRGAYLLGLTATPVRMNEVDEKRLWEIFDHKIIHQVRMGELIDKGILSHPVPVIVNTNVEMEREFSEQDYKYLHKYGELAPTVLQSLAKNASRNSLIVDHYKSKAPDGYGKTIVFAVNVLHARTLAQEFEQAGVKTDYVDYARSNNQEIIDAFRDESFPAVIVNVEMLT